MRVAVLATVQLLDGFANTSLNVRGELPELLAAAGFREVAPSRAGGQERGLSPARVTSTSRRAAALERPLAAVRAWRL